MQLQLQPTHLVSANTIVPVGSGTSGGVKKALAGGSAGAAAAAGGGLVIAVGSGMYPACRHKLTRNFEILSWPYDNNRNHPWSRLEGSQLCGALGLQQALVNARFNTNLVNAVEQKGQKHAIR